MAKGSSVREHCLRMISHLNVLEVLGTDIDGESQADMILQSLLESFKELKLVLILIWSKLLLQNLSQKARVKRRRRRKTSPSKMINKLP